MSCAWLDAWAPSDVLTLSSLLAAILEADREGEPTDPYLARVVGMDISEEQLGQLITTAASLSPSATRLRLSFLILELSRGSLDSVAYLVPECRIMLPALEDNERFLYEPLLGCFELELDSAGTLVHLATRTNTGYVQHVAFTLEGLRSTHFPTKLEMLRASAQVEADLHLRMRGCDRRLLQEVENEVGIQSDIRLLFEQLHAP